MMNDSLLSQYKTLYQDAEPEYHVFSPYCLCPLGAHVDHQHGLITGFALDRGIDILCSSTDDGEVQMTSLSFYGTLQTNVHTPQTERFYDWGDYLRGALWALQQEHQLRRGVRGIISGSMPSGGIASSAALLCGFMAALARANDIQIDRQKLVELTSRAERLFVGLSSGVLDQSCVSLCLKNQLLYLDTDSQQYQFQNFGAVGKGGELPFKVVIFYSGVTRSLTTTDYNLRVQECRTAANLLLNYEGKNVDLETSLLRDVRRQTFDKYAAMMPPRYARRARHFFSECERVRQGLESWRKGEVEQFGELMFESCESSILNYECGSPELIALYRCLRHMPGVYGSRFCGAGFIGSCFALVAPDAVDEVRSQVTADYLSHFPMFKDAFRTFVCELHSGMEFVE